MYANLQTRMTNTWPLDNSMIGGIAAFLALGVLILEQVSGSTFLKKNKATKRLMMHEWRSKQTKNEWEHIVILWHLQLLLHVKLTNSMNICVDKSWKIINPFQEIRPFWWQGCNEAASFTSHNGPPVPPPPNRPRSRTGGLSPTPKLCC